MKRVRKLLAVAGVLGAVLAVGGGVARAGEKSFSFPEVTIDAQVLPDGTLALEERRTFDFNGSFSFAFFTIDSTHAPPENIVDFTVRENGDVIDHIPTVEFGSFKAQWNFSAQDEERTFVISYRVLCAVDVYSDAGHLLWQFVGTGWTEPTNLVRVTLRLPEKAVGSPPRAETCPGPVPDVGYELESLGPREVRAWGHGPLNGEVEFVDPQTVEFRVEVLPAGQFVEGSILFPPSVVPLAAQRDEPGFARILAEERGFARETNAFRRRARLESLGSKVLLGAVPAFMLLMVLLARRRDRVRGVPSILQEPPEPSVHPVELALLWSAYRGHLSPKTAYRTQLLHLARTGAIEVSAVGRVTDPEDFQVTLRREPEGDPDKDFTEFLFTGDGHQPVSLKEMNTGGTRGKRLRRWWTDLGEKAKSNVQRIKQGNARLESYLSGAAGIGAAYYGIRLLGGPVGHAVPGGLIAVGFLGWLVSLGFLPPRLPPDLRERFGQWKAFRRFLKTFATLDDAPALAVIVWEQYLVYAVALGVADEVEKQVRALVPEEALAAPWPGAPSGAHGFIWYRTWHTDTPAYAPAAAAAAAGWSSGMGSMSSGGGFGGGFSGGGGGGGGGTGGGAG